MSRPRSTESVFRAIADRKRRRILDLLRVRECTVGEIATTIRLQKAAATFHLGVLLHAGLMRQQRRGRNLMCNADTRPLELAHGWLGSHVLPANGKEKTQRAARVTAV